MFTESEFLFTAETTPNLSTDLARSAGKIDPLVGLADAINITDSPNCQTKLSSLLVAAEVKRKGLDVILQLPVEIETGLQLNQNFWAPSQLM